MGQFGIETRRWLESIIKQRKWLLHTNHNHKPQHEVTKALYELEILLGTYTYENDLHMARFIAQKLQNIETIIPGSGATCHAKRMRELSEINKKAILIMKGQHESVNRQQAEIQKTIQYDYRR